MESDLCAYGCGNKGVYEVTAAKKLCCSKHHNSCSGLKRKNSEGLKLAYKEGRRPNNYVNYSQDIKDRMAWSKGKTRWEDNRIHGSYDNESLFRLYKKGEILRCDIKKILVKNLNIEYKCSECGIIKWRGRNITLELHHINGNRNDNRLENLEFLCLNCHSQTRNFRGRNISKKNYHQVPEKKILEAISTSENIHQVLLKIGLAPKGGNYDRIKKILNKHDLNF